MSVHFKSVPEEHRPVFTKCCQLLLTQLLNKQSKCKIKFKISIAHLVISQESQTYGDLKLLLWENSQSYSILLTEYCVKDFELSSMFYSMVRKLIIYRNQIQDESYKLFVASDRVVVKNILENPTYIDLVNILNSDLDIASKSFIWD